MNSVYNNFRKVQKNLAGVHDALQRNGATTTTGEHSHSYLIDRDGNGATTGMIGNSAVEHIHDIKAYEVQPAQDHIHSVI